MSNKPKTIKIDEVEYVRADSVRQSFDAEHSQHGWPFVIIRSHGAGVFAGYLKVQDNPNRRVVLMGCIRMWRWTGATLSQVARDGIAGSGENKFGVATDNHEIFDVLEIIPCTLAAKRAIQGVKSWEV